MKSLSIDSFGGRSITEWEKFFHSYDGHPALDTMVVRGVSIHGDETYLHIIEEDEIGLGTIFVPEIPNSKKLADLIYNRGTINERGYIELDGAWITFMELQLLGPYWKRIHILEEKVKRLEWYIDLKEI